MRRVNNIKLGDNVNLNQEGKKYRTTKGKLEGGQDNHNQIKRWKDKILHSTKKLQNKEMIQCLFVEHIYSFNWCKMEIKLDEKGEQYYNGRQYEFNSGDKIKNAGERGQ